MKLAKQFSNIYVWSCRKKHIGCIVNLFQKPQSMICLQTPRFVWSFQDGRQLASKPVHHNNELLDPVLFMRLVLFTLLSLYHIRQADNRKENSECVSRPCTHNFPTFPFLNPALHRQCMKIWKIGHFISIKRSSNVLFIQFVEMDEIQRWQQLRM